MGSDMRIRFTGIKWLWLALCLAGCSDKYQTLVDAAPSPHVNFDRDTIVIRERDAQYVARVLNPFVKIYAIPSLPQLNIQFNDSSGKVHFSYRGIGLREGSPLIVAGDSTSIFCHCDTPGLYAVDFYLTDYFGKTDSRTLIVNCLGNDRARAVLSISLLDSSISGNWQYRLDGRASTKKYGLIKSYYFIVDGQMIYAIVPFIDYSFHRTGEHSVQFFVSDDLSVHSETVTQKITIP
jgi:hypothetical protein